MTISFATLWLCFKWAGIVLGPLSLLLLVGGSLPDHQGSSEADALRPIVWGAFALWLVVVLIHGLVT